MRRIQSVILAAAMFLGAQSVAGQTTRPAEESLIVGLKSDGVVRVPLNKGAVLTTRVPYARLSVAQPEIADVTPVGATSILLTAKKAGSTQLIVWDEAGRSQVIEVTVAGDLGMLQDQLNAMFPGAKVQVSGSAGAVVLRGRVANVEVSQQMDQIAEGYGKVLNFLEISGGRQVMLQVRFAEVSKTATTALGVNFAGTDGVSSFGSNIGQVNPALNLTPGQINPQPVSSSVTLFGSGRVASIHFEYFLNALRQNNLMRVLAEPNIIAISGQEAALLAGGQIPIPVAQSGAGGGGATVTVEYKDFGVRLKFVPVVLGDGKIRLKVEPEVSDLDFTNAIRASGFLIPALTKRTVSTTVELSEGQTFAIAGLLNNRVNASSDVTPLLGDVPFIGALFRSVRYSRQETELVVLVTPKLVEAMNPEQVPAVPGERWRTPTENELFWNADLGGPAEENGRKLAVATPGGPPKFRGAYGFTPPGNEGK